MRIPHNVGASVLISSLLSLFFLITGSHTEVHAQQPAVSTNQDTERGIELYAQNRIPEAIEALRKAVRKDTGDYRAWYFLGLAQIRKKDLKNASKSFEAALKLQPRFAGGHTGLAYALLLRNKSSDAIREAQAALGLDPQAHEAHYIIGVARLRAGAKEEALEQAEVTIKLRPQFAPGYLLKSQALVNFLGDALIPEKDESEEVRRGRYRDAAEALKKYLQLTPTADDKQTWTDQLESLGFYATTHNLGDPEEAFSGREVTTKVRVLNKPEPTYTEVARNNQISGTVVLRVIFAADGTVKHLLVMKELSYGLTEQAIKAARLIKFDPAMKDGKPVSMYMQLEYHFNL